MKPEISIIIRTKNEERWIGHCLKMVFQQSYKNFEVILVDNESSDHTVAVARHFPLKKIIHISEYRPGYALNEGIRVSHGDFIVCLSGHCIPKETKWLENLRRNFVNGNRIAGVYGRQLPIRFTSPVDKRDLLMVFGQDRRIQIKDYFFHNANSMLSKEIWERFPFDEQVTNIEDRVWGKAVIEAGYRIAYDPEAAVYHHHGLHQNNKADRAKGVVSIIERVDEEVVNSLPESLTPGTANIIAAVPIKGTVKTASIEYQLLSNTISALKESKFVSKIYLITEDQNLTECFDLAWVNRNEIRGANKMSINELMYEALHRIESKNIFPEALLYINYDYLFRPQNLFDELIKDALFNGYDTVFPGLVDFGHYWFNNSGGDFIQTDSSFKPRDQRKPLYRALYGLGCLSSAWVVRSGKLVGGKIGILAVNNHRNALRIRDLKSESIDKDYLDSSGDREIRI